MSIVSRPKFLCLGDTMRPETLFPITQKWVEFTLSKMGYSLVCAEGGVLQFEKDGTASNHVAPNGPPLITCQKPDFSAPHHDGPVFDRSDVIDLLIEITGESRTEAGFRLVAILRSGDTEEATSGDKCGTCRGTGVIPVLQAVQAGALKKTPPPCPDCGGTGVRAA